DRASFGARPCWTPSGETNEAHLPAERPQAREAARLQAPHGHAGGAGHPPEPPAEGPAAALGLIVGLRGRRAFAALRREGVRGRAQVLDVLWRGDAGDTA